LDLGIFPERLYGYLGRTLERFGSFAFAVASISSRGEMSPFDTGGLVHRMPPVSTWTSALRQQFLRDYSWPTSSLATLITAYPGSNVADLERYLNTSQRPVQRGPHQVWTSKMQADIWAVGTHWCAWTWEGRFEVSIPVGDQLVGWTCTPTSYGEILRWGDTEATDLERDLLQTVLPKWIGGGVATLVEHLKARQVSA
jgi:hypothetical protein